MASLLSDNGWMANAACAGSDPELWTMEHGDWGVPPEAAAVCASCPVVLPCLTYALTQRQTGVWAGTGFKTRRLIKAWRCPCGARLSPARAARYFLDATPPQRRLCPACLAREAWLRRKARWTPFGNFPSGGAR